MKCWRWLTGVVTEIVLPLRARTEFGAETVEDLQLSLRARVPDFASPGSPPVSLQGYRSDGGDGDETDSRPGWWARRASRQGRDLCSGRRSRWLSSRDQESFSTTSKGLGELASFLSDAAVDTVVMEATGVYWKPVYYSLEGLFEELWLCNAQHVKNVPGRKSDLSDAEWLATSLHTVWCGHPLSHRRRSERSRR
jgi:hypothetical protein